MFGKIMVLLVAATGALAVPAQASPVKPESAHDLHRRPWPAATERLQLAQAGDVEVYYDEQGRRIVVDAFTGEILHIERPADRYDRRTSRRAGRDYGEQGRYYLDDPQDMERFRRDQGLYQPPLGNDEQYPDEYRVYPDEPDQTYRQSRGEPYEEQPPILAYPSDPNKGSVIGEPVERRPLPLARQGVAPSEPAAVEPALPQAEPSIGFAAHDEVAALQVLLDRAGAKPGVIDGRFGSNVDKALLAYGEITGKNLKSTDVQEIRQALAATGGDAFTTYEITAVDAAGSYVASIPEDYGEKARLDRLGYTSVAEMLAERFHMDERYLKALNPEANFNRPGTIIKVANVGAPARKEVVRIVADKGRKQVRGYGADGRVVVAYPATIGSAATPSPTGTHAVSRIAVNPEYTYNPRINFRQGNNNGVLRIPPGPNGPVGSIWIALDKPTYGIHGTPDPSKIGKTGSHGCVRLTNWDAQELAKLVKPGVPVDFIE